MRLLPRIHPLSRRALFTGASLLISNLGFSEEQARFLLSPYVWIHPLVINNAVFYTVPPKDEGSTNSQVATLRLLSRSYSDGRASLQVFVYFVDGTHRVPGDDLARIPMVEFKTKEAEMTASDCDYLASYLLCHGIISGRFNAAIISRALIDMSRTSKGIGARGGMMHLTPGMKQFGMLDANGTFDVTNFEMTHETFIGKYFRDKDRGEGGTWGVTGSIDPMPIEDVNVDEDHYLGIVAEAIAFDELKARARAPLNSPALTPRSLHSPSRFSSGCVRTHSRQVEASVARSRKTSTLPQPQQGRGISAPKTSSRWPRPASRWCRSSEDQRWRQTKLSCVACWPRNSWDART